MRGGTERVFAAVFVAFLLVSLPVCVGAAGSLTTAPLVIDERAAGRDILTREITLTNTGTMPLTVYPTVNNISLSDGGRIEEFIAPVESDRTSSLASWIEIARSGIKLQIGETKTIPLTIRMHPEPKPGVYHAFIGFGFGRNRDEAEKLVELGRAPGTVITVTVEDDSKSILKLSRFIIDRFITSGKNQAAAYTITNPGDTELVPSGEIIIYNNRGEEVTNIEVNPGRESIAPGGNKEFNADVPAQGLFGKYKAFLTVEYGPQLANVNDTVYFYVFPLWSTLLVFGIISILAVFGALFVHRRYLDEETVDDSESLPLHIRPTYSDSTEHDIDLKRQ